MHPFTKEEISDILSNGFLGSSGDLRREGAIKSLFVSVSIVAALGALGSAAPAASTNAVPDEVREDRSAFASWLVPTSKPNQYRWFAIDATRSTRRQADSERVVAFLTEGKCRETKRMLNCGGSGPYLRHFKGTFEVASDVSSAKFETRHDGAVYQADWTTADAIPGFYSASESCQTAGSDEDFGFGGGVFHPALTVGVFGDKKLKKRHSELDMSRIWSGVMVTGCEDLWPSYVIDGERFEATWEIPLSMLSAR